MKSLVVAALFAPQISDSVQHGRPAVRVVVVVTVRRAPGAELLPLAAEQLTVRASWGLGVFRDIAGLTVALQCSKFRVHPAPGVHNLVAGCTCFRTCVPGRCIRFRIF